LIFSTCWSATPGGTLIFTLRKTSVRPSPPQRPHSRCAAVPAPAHAGHAAGTAGRGTPSPPHSRRSMLPVPPQMGHSAARASRSPPAP
jgi:hypothetical protein